MGMVLYRSHLLMLCCGCPDIGIGLYHLDHKVVGLRHRRLENVHAIRPEDACVFGVTMLKLDRSWKILPCDLPRLRQQLSLP